MDNEKAYLILLTKIVRHLPVMVVAMAATMWMLSVSLRSISKYLSKWCSMISCLLLSTSTPQRFNTSKLFNFLSCEINFTTCPTFTLPNGILLPPMSKNISSPSL
uniref:Uncharacterized protein n=1 Tax=Rhizophagus irregularis (strain DAOM 181602 / DAOM 197198 / MUCL 43194) TaxID=747089 RepID=U9TSZ7_RHIID